MDPVTYLEEDTLTRPAVVCAFRGWNDGGEAATIALQYLGERWAARPYASIDPEEFYDFQVNRPMVRLEEGVSRFIEWPKAEFRSASVGGRDVLLFSAPEPNNRWRGFTEAVIGVARRAGSEILVTMGGFLTDVPHTRPVQVVGSAQDPETATRLGLSRSQYEGPTGITGVVHDVAIRAGLPSVSLWAAVPHYLPAAPNPKAARALVERTTAVLELPVDLGPIGEHVTDWERSVGRLVEDSEELAEYVRRLEAATDQGMGIAGQRPMADEAMPSGDVIAAELERFLREQDPGPGGSS